ncbi:hypothetical protein QWZ10_20510 [Paracoccus cavernae]|uniref:Uncharacterized protein n=1 Tax=Paracoccus cavernae TaxID=1571207 RepID=A0ABT8DE27_9RHOB|nr:hypothetical protein [Paracoccus cavernae]
MAIVSTTTPRSAKSARRIWRGWTASPASMTGSGSPAITTRTAKPCPLAVWSGMMLAPARSFATSKATAPMSRAIYTPSIRWQGAGFAASSSPIIT